MSKVIQRTGLRPVGSKRIRTFHRGSGALAVRDAKAGDCLDDELVSAMSDEGLDRFSRELAKRGLEFGEVSFEGPTEHAGRSWLLYPVGQPDWED